MEAGSTGTECVSAAGVVSRPRRRFAPSFNFIVRLLVHFIIHFLVAIYPQKRINPSIDPVC